MRDDDTENVPENRTPDNAEPVRGVPAKMRERWEEAMMKPIRMTIPGKPIAKKRPRFARAGKFVRTYNDQETEEGRFLLLAMENLPPEPLPGAVMLDCLFVFPRPKSHYGTGRNSDKLKKSAPLFHTSKPDTDNLVKFVKDCLNEYAWKDDSQVICVSAYKRYGDHPRTEIKIYPVE